MPLLRRRLGLSLLLACLVALAQGVPGPVAHAQDYAALLAAPDRTEADRANDKRRAALELLTFTGPQSGWRVLDLGAGAGYSTELMARAVAPDGKVWGQNPAPVENFEKRLKTPAMRDAASLVTSYNDPAPGLPPLDLITFFFAYHDVTAMDVDRARMNAALFAALKPGGLLVIADHSARPQDGASVGKTYHRGAEATLRAEVEAAGFTLVDTGDFLRNPDDPRTTLVFRSPVKVDEFVLKFQKPR